MSMTHKEQMDLGKAIKEADWSKAVQMLKERGYSLETVQKIFERNGYSKELVEEYW